MNLTISPINYNFLKNIQSNKEQASFEEKQSLFAISFKESQALKSQVLFRANYKKEISEDILKKYNLKLYPETFEEIVTNQNIAWPELAKYTRKGKEVFILYLRGELHKIFPYKDVAELNDLTSKFNKPQNISRITKELFGSKLFPYSTEESENRNLSRKFYAILGAITIEGEEEGYQNALDFLNESVSSILISPNYVVKKNFREEFYDDMAKRGFEPKDFFIGTKLNKNGFSCSIFYKNNHLTTAFTDATKKRAAITAAMTDVVSRLDNNKLCLDDMEWTEQKYIDYVTLDDRRAEKLQKFCQEYNLSFSDINLLNRVFLVANMPDGSMLSTYESYEPLEFIGDGVLQFCTHEYLFKNTPADKKGVIGKRLHEFVSNENLTKLSLEMGLGKLLLTKSPLKDKRYADLFEALLGAIYIDGGIDGIDNVYKFLDENFRNEILGI